jgi:uncharacterized protein (DUF58 family)
MSDAMLDAAFLKKLERLSLSVRRPFAGQMKGEKRSLRRGASIEFADYRDYQPGDDLRYVDWNMAARLDRLFIKLFVEEEDLYLALLVDTSKSMDFGAPRKLETAVRAAAAIGYVGLSNYDRVMVQPYAGAAGSPLPVQRGRMGVPRLFSYLQRLDAAGGVSFAESLRRYATASRHRGLAVLFTDLLDLNWRDGLKPLMARGFQVAIVHVLSAEEISPTLVGDLRLVDSETGEAREMSVNPQLMARYRRTFDGFCAEIETFCHRYGIDYIRVSSDVSIEDLALKQMRRIGILQ